MNSTFWLWLIPAVLTFGLIAWATDRALCRCERAYRHWQARREMHKAAGQIKMRVIETYDIGYDGVKRNRVSHAPEGSVSRRVELEGLATSQDRWSRRIH